MYRNKNLLLTVIIAAITLLLLNQVSAQTQNADTDKEDKITLKDFLPALGIIVGGLLTVLGGFSTNYILQATARNAEKRKIFSQSLSAFYTQVREYGYEIKKQYKWCSKQCQTGESIRSDEVNEIAKEAQKGLALIGLHDSKIFPISEQFLDSLEAFDNAVQTLPEAMHEISKITHGAGEEERLRNLQEHFEDNVRPAYGKAIGYKEELENAIRKAFQDQYE